MSLPYLPLFPDAYFGDTKHLTCEEHGAYLQLLMIAWRSGGIIPDDDAQLARMTSLSRKRWAAIKSTILQFWIRHPNGGWSQKRLVEELREANARIETRRAAGRLGGRPKSLENKDEGKANGFSDGKQNESKTKAPISNPIRSTQKATPSSFSRATPFPEDFQPNEADLSAGAALGDKPEAVRSEVIRFRDHHVAKGTLFKDWHAAFRTWLRSPYRSRAGPLPANPGLANSHINGNSRHGTHQKRTLSDVFRDRLADIEREEQESEPLHQIGRH